MNYGQKSMKLKFQKGFAAIILEIAVAALIIGAFILANPKFKISLPSTPSPAISPSPSPTDETANWKTFTNNQQKFEIKYPPNVEVGIAPMDPDQKAFSLTSPKFNFSIHVEGAKPNDTAKKLAKINTPDPSRDTAIGFVKQTEYVLDGVKGEIVIYQFKQNKEVHVYLFIIKNSKIYSFSSADLQDQEIQLKRFDQILSTFKFLDENRTVCAQVITPARNQTTGECKQFPTPCDVPTGWQKVEKCPSSGSACPTPPECVGTIIYGDPNPNEPNQCPRYSCSSN